MVDNHLCPHDRFFRKLMSNANIARDFFCYTLPQKIRARIDLDNIQLMHDSFIDDKLRQQTSDLLYSLKFDNNRPGYIYILVEHQSAPDEMMPLRILKYMISIMDQHAAQTDSKVLPIIYPMIFYSGAKPYGYSTDLFALFGEDSDFVRELWFCPYQLINLSGISDADFERFKLSCSMVKLMKYIHHFRDDVAVLLKKVAPNLRETMPVCDMDYIYTALTYLLECGNIYDADDFKNTIKREFSEIDEDGFMTLINPWCNEARQQGMIDGMRKGKLEGKLEGKHEGKLEVARNMLAQAIPAETVASITGLPLSEIMKLQKQ
jgi:predicted transposase/invertase (TIGR01784 family)